MTSKRKFAVFLYPEHTTCAVPTGLLDVWRPGRRCLAGWKKFLKPAKHGRGPTQSGD